MAWFKCSIEGENFPGVLVRKKGLVGFHTTRWVEAPSADEAEALALEALRVEPNFQIKTPDIANDAKVYFNEIVEVDGPGGVNSGATWFSMS